VPTCHKKTKLAGKRIEGRLTAPQSERAWSANLGKHSFIDSRVRGDAAAPPLNVIPLVPVTALTIARDPPLIWPYRRGHLSPSLPPSLPPSLSLSLSLSLCLCVSLCVCVCVCLKNAHQLPSPPVLYEHRGLYACAQE
jgi:hypothetical protein